MKEINSLPTEAPMPPPPAKQGTPHLNPTVQSVHILLFLSFRSRYLLIGGLICQENREKLRSEMCSKDVLRKKIYMSMCMHKLITMRMRGEGCNARTVNCGLTTGPCHCLTLWFFFLYLAHYLPEFFPLGRH